MSIAISDNAASVEAVALAARFNSGKLRLYSGSRPATPDTSVGGATLLAELTFGSPAFGAAASGVITANAITKCSSAAAGGSATWYRCVESDGTTPICDGDVTASGAGGDIQMASTTIIAGQEVTCSSFSHTVSKS